MSPTISVATGSRHGVITGYLYWFKAIDGISVQALNITTKDRITGGAPNSVRVKLFFGDKTVSRFLKPQNQP